MATEIERKFLVEPALWRADPAGGTTYRQGYLSVDPDRVVRVRVAGEAGTLTIKGRTTGIARPEFEYAIPVAEARTMLDTLCLRPTVEKVRYRVLFSGRVWEVDVFAGDNAGLITAEVELPSADAPFARPPWLGREVSHDARYFNANLARHPYGEWSSDERARA